MKFLQLTIFVALLLFVACKNEAPADSGNTEGAVATDEKPVEATPTKLTVNIENLRLRATAGEDSNEMARLPKGTIVYDMGEVSDFTTSVKLRGIQFNEPWIKVKTEKGLKGWVYAGGLHFDMNEATGLSERLMQIRLQNMFGKSIGERMKAYRSNYQKATNSSDFAKVYREGLQLRDTIVTLLGMEVPEVDYEQIADLFWLEEAMPGYRVQLVAEGTAYYLFNDYQQFSDKAALTTGEEDDKMAGLYFQLFEVDSVEHFFPSWFLQTWDYGGSSLLGRGIHFELLQKMEENYEQGLFIPEINSYRNRIIEDITNPHNSYWESKNRILDELDKILDKGFQQLTKEDVIALKTRRKMFENPEANEIKVDLRSGY